jgi:hypothetical protein
MDIKIPDPGPVKEAIEAATVRPQYFLVAGLVLSAIAIIDVWSSTGLGIAAAGAFLAAAWLQGIIMTGFLSRTALPSTPPPNPPSPAPQPSPTASQPATPPPPPAAEPPLDSHLLIDLEPPSDAKAP